MDISTTTTLNNGIEMPILGLGTWQIQDREVAQVIDWALEFGYRAIDTASMYKNESGVGAAVRASDLTRGNIFVTSKVWNSDQGYDSTHRAFSATLERLGLDYLDLYLIHWPSKAHMADTWRAMEELHESGVIRSIGVSNFRTHHLDQLMTTAKVAPAVNQIEHHPRLQQPDLVTACEELDIRITAWSPLMRGGVGEIEPLVEIADEIGATPAQVTLRWMLERGVIAIPKTVRRERIEENANLFHFEISPAQMATLNSLDQGHRTGPDPDDFPGT